MHTDNASAGSSSDGRNNIVPRDRVSQPGGTQAAGSGSMPQLVHESLLHAVQPSSTSMGLWIKRPSYLQGEGRIFGTQVSANSSFTPRVGNPSISSDYSILKSTHIRSIVFLIFRLPWHCPLASIMIPSASQEKGRVLELGSNSHP